MRATLFIMMIVFLTGVALGCGTDDEELATDEMNAGSSSSCGYLKLIYGYIYSNNNCTYNTHSLV